MILCLIQLYDIKQMLKFYFQASVVVELRVINPDGVGPDGGEDIMFCFNIRVDVVENRKI
jgi:hypothetical protein